MTRHNAQQFIPIIQALANGEQLQTSNNNKWYDCDKDGCFTFSLDPSYYRIKPKAPREWKALVCKDFNFGSPVFYNYTDGVPSHRCRNCEIIVVREQI